MPEDKFPLDHSLGNQGPPARDACHEGDRIEHARPNRGWAVPLVLGIGQRLRSRVSVLAGPSNYESIAD
jgi:hypothetical protein